ncbi:MAG: hypothetical protein KIS92_25930 [Planctomycetota bacterium]|nr:hypothetical protein [Planctomycetota bacterium]
MTLACAALAHAEESAPAPLTPQNLRTLIDNLGAEKFTVRDNAEAKLLAGASVEVLSRLQELALYEDDAEIRTRACMLLPEVRERIGDAIYSKDFYILGPCPFPEDDFQWGGENKPEWMRHATPLDNLKEIDLGAQYKVAYNKAKHLDNGQGPDTNVDATIGWKRPYKNGKGLLDFRALFPDCPNYATAFVLTFVKSNGISRARFYIGSDDGVGLWVNGQCKHFNVVHRGLVKDQDAVDVDLQDGWNPVILRIHQGWGGWGMGMRVTDRMGKPWPEQDIDPDCNGEAKPMIAPPALPPEHKDATKTVAPDAKEKEKAPQAEKQRIQVIQKQ